MIEQQPVYQPGVNTPLQVGTGRLDVTNPPQGGSGVPRYGSSYGTVVDYREQVLFFLHNINDELKRIRQHIEGTIK
jgi:hypothetical protein